MTDWQTWRPIYISLGLALSLNLSGFLPLLPVAAERFEPPNLGRPGRRVGGGTRGGCAFGNPARLTALLPDSNLGLTTQPYPTFYWFVPQNSAQLVEFSLYRAETTAAERQLVYRSTFVPDRAAGIASLKLPESVGLPPLALEQDYQWSVALVCNAEARQQDLRVDGWIQRIDPTADLAAQLAREPVAAHAALYAANGLWFDAIAQLISLRQGYPQSATVQARWAELLTSVGLAEMAEQPIFAEPGQSQETEN
ncbi:DUF928 domain-containing protein [Almyronema epifaneia]|uniref:DUF928 domain-containing protein n=1 Tax=Almyronema epifaneia S1 TaxID=2991925 RepID=A0ABW6IIQ1_9CYAN